uniref:Caspase recruitment domain-containing protein 8-like n=1 Tax=Callorhinchus milii TaxID=7868 RepID=A0A4W3JMJ4_CALMI|eukprot:gi/632967668/ref/XP_007900105.1/ PREDICTED: caspase recruitment domain-containing protein 8-like [Callorhinchus milii]
MSFRSMSVVDSLDALTLEEHSAKASQRFVDDDVIYLGKSKSANRHSNTAGRERRPVKEFEEYKRISCELCGEEDSSKWIMVEPKVHSENEMMFSVSLPGTGDYECSKTGLRWETNTKTIISYRYGSWKKDVSMMNSDLQICGPLFDFHVKGQVTAIHLPHFLCLKGCTPKDELKIIHVKDGNYSLMNPSAINGSHVELKAPSFSLLSVVISKVSSRLFPVHTLAMIYRTRMVGELTLHVYFVPNECSIIKAVNEQESGAMKIEKPPQIKSLSYGKTYFLTSPANVNILPPAINFCYLRSDQRQQYCEVYSQDENASIELKLRPEKKSDPLWVTLLRPMELQVPPKVPLTANLAVEFINRHKKSIIERLGVIDPYLRHLLEEKVINEDEEEEIRINPKRTRRNETLVRMVMKKGPHAQEQLYRAMETHDPFLVKDLQ